MTILGLQTGWQDCGSYGRTTGTGAVVQSLRGEIKECPPRLEKFSQSTAAERFRARTKSVFGNSSFLLTADL